MKRELNFRGTPSIRKEEEKDRPEKETEMAYRKC